jgi:protein-L-isoaspartate(D-aspartate) O-methyltransferase
MAGPAGAAARGRRVSLKPPRFPLGIDRVAPGSRNASTTTQRPQRPVHDAAANALLRANVPSGMGLDSASVRARMVERLRREGVHSPMVLDAFGKVPRHHFVDSALVTQAYEDTSLPIGLGQTISKPSVVGRMIELLCGGRNARARGSLGRVLEIGTGCGYQAALLACMSTQVVSVERLRPLHDKARDLLAPLRRDNLRLVYGDGRFGHPPNAPYDTIIAAAGGEELPPAWLDQMAVGGRLVAPMRAAQGTGQVLVVVDRSESDWTRTTDEVVQFVPLKFGVD